MNGAVCVSRITFRCKPTGCVYMCRFDEVFLCECSQAVMRRKHDSVHRLSRLVEQQREKSSLKAFSNFATIESAHVPLHVGISRPGCFLAQTNGSFPLVHGSVPTTS